MERTRDEEPDLSELFKDDLWNADPNCEHNIIEGSGGGVRCTKCSGWHCL